MRKFRSRARSFPPTPATPVFMTAGARALALFEKIYRICFIKEEIFLSHRGSGLRSSARVIYRQDEDLEIVVMRAIFFPFAKKYALLRREVF